jgi:Domain of unknown function (DUF4157)
MASLADRVRRPPSVPSVAGLDLRSIRRVSMPGERAEREADRMAEQVARGRVAAPGPGCPCGGACPRCRSAAGESAGTGRPLDPRTRSLMETGFGHDFGRVRIHADGEAASAAHSFDARAFTVGSHVVFGAGEYRPASGEGRTLLAHELAHVVQQAGSTAGQAVLARKPGAKTTTGWIGPDNEWTYVAYSDEQMIRVARNVSSTSRDRRIGTIPWITHNPGNLTVDPAGAASKKPGAREPFNQGASSTIFKATPKAGFSYAIFGTRSEGLNAILPVLQVIDESNRSDKKTPLTMRQALSIYYAGTIPKKEDIARKLMAKSPPPTQEEADTQAADTVARLEAERKAYVEGRTGTAGGITEKGVRQFMAEAIQQEEPSLDPKRADQEADRMLNRPVPSFADDRGDFDFVAAGITAKEGRLNAPGIEYRCDGGFEPNDPADYTPDQVKAIDAFKRDQVAALRTILGCA